MCYKTVDSCQFLSVIDLAVNMQQMSTEMFYGYRYIDR